MQNAFFLIFLTEIFGHVKKKSYLCTLFRRVHGYTYMQTCEKWYKEYARKQWNIKLNKTNLKQQNAYNSTIS